MEENRINSVGETADTIGGGENLETPHKRRVRYKGTHPRSYKEKYKELQPEKYGDTIAKVISKGSTPAGMHISIMVKEILDFLNIQPGQTGLDATLGYGGHTSHMLACLKGEGHMYALDVDTIEMEKTRKRLADKGFGPDILTIKHLNFAILTRWQRKQAVLTLFWLTWEFLPCRSTIRTEVFPLKMKVRWI